MHYHSPAAYRYLRSKFNNTLPCKSTLCNWFSQSNLQCLPGILPEAIQSLKSLVEKSREKDEKIYASLAFDEVYIRKHIQWVHENKTWFGYITHGELNDQKKLPIANQILLFMVTIAGQCVSIPVAYYAISKLNADEKLLILLKVLYELTVIGVKVINITFDGLPANLAVCEKLGCSFNINDPKPFFINPTDGSKVFIIFDPCHMLKLMRNALGDLGYITDPKCGRIQWSYFESLESFRVQSKFVTHRFTKRHVQYRRNRMNVRLAAQTFSNGVATSFSHLLVTGHRAFQGCEATISFVEKLNKLFDIMNTKRVNNGRIFKSALNPNNAAQIFKFFDEMCAYLTSLKFNKKLCIDSRRKTGFLGFFINMHSIRRMYEVYVLSNQLPDLSIYYHSQDPLESFFSRIRALQGSNDNPTLQQFISAIRKLLFYNEITSPELASCKDSLNILTVSSVNRLKRTLPLWQSLNNSNEEEELDEYNEEDDDQNGANNVAKEAIRTFEQHSNLSTVDYLVGNLEDTSIAFFAGVIEKKIGNSCFSCVQCMNVFRENFKINGHFIANQSSQLPCESTFIICKCAHIVFDEKRADSNFNYDSILKEIKVMLSNKELFEESDFAHSSDHKQHFIDAIIDQYIKLYGTYIAKCLTLEQYQNMLRATNKRSTIFAGQ